MRYAVPSPSLDQRRVLNAPFNARWPGSWNGFRGYSGFAGAADLGCMQREQAPQGLAGWAGDGDGYRDVKGSGGYYYRQWENGRIYILAGSPAGVGRSYDPPFAPGSAGDAISAEIGPYPSSSAWSAIATALGGGDAKNALKNVLSATSSYGPEVVAAVKDLAANSGQSLESLNNKLAKKVAQYSTTTSQKKKIQLAYEIKGLQAQIALQEQVAAAGMSVVGEGGYTPQASNGMPGWVIPAGILAVLVGGGLFLLRR